MAIISFEGIVEAGKICPPEGMQLAEGATVYIVVSNTTLNKNETSTEKSFETRKISVAEYEARGAEIDAAYADFPDAEEAATLRLMRSKAMKVARREKW